MFFLCCVVFDCVVMLFCFCVVCLQASNLHPADADGKSDPYIVLRLGRKEINTNAKRSIMIKTSRNKMFSVNIANKFETQEEIIHKMSKPHQYSQNPEMAKQ